MTEFLRYLPAALLLPTLFLLAPQANGAKAVEVAPFANGETLTYEVVWPSGLDLGQAVFKTHARTGGWEFEAELTASLPKFEIKDIYRSVANAALCSREFDKDVSHGRKKTKEAVIFDLEKNQATRRTVGGGESEFATPPCVKDALAFLYHLRQELALGRIPPPDDVNFGGMYQITVTYAEALKIEIAGEQREVEKIVIDLSGPDSQHSFEIFFGRDKARTPLLMRVPFELGTFSLKLKP